MKTLKDLVSISPLIGAFLIFLGMLKLIIYYSFFGVHIVQYIQFSEILSSFLEDLNIILVLFAFLIFHGILGFKLIGTNKSDTHYLRNLSKATKSKFALYYYPIAFIISCVLYIKYPCLFWVYFTTILLFSILIVLFRRYFNRIKINENWSIIYILSSMIVVFTINLAINDILKAKQNNQKVELQLKDECITLNANERFIGKTNEFLFISNTADKSITIVSSSEIKSIKFYP